MEDQVTNNNLNDSGETQNADQIQSVRAELITLAEKGEIKQSVAYIKKASQGALEKIKGDYERKQLEETNEYISETLMGKLSEFMEATNMIDDAKSMEEELVHNKIYGEKRFEKHTRTHHSLHSAHRTRVRSNYRWKTRVQQKTCRAYREISFLTHQWCGYRPGRLNDTGLYGSNCLFVDSVIVMWFGKYRNNYKCNTRDDLYVTCY